MGVGIDQARQQGSVRQGYDPRLSGNGDFVRRAGAFDAFTANDDHPVFVGVGSDTIKDAGGLEDYEGGLLLAFGSCPILVRRTGAGAAEKSCTATRQH